MNPWETRIRDLRPLLEASEFRARSMAFKVILFFAVAW